MAANICVDVVKYSHATGVRSDNSIPWTHLTGSNIFALIKRADTHSADSELSLQVVQGTTVLENVHLSSLIDSAIAARQGSQQAGIQPQVEQLPIFGISKDALLALRYRVPHGQTRRIQFRLQSPAECSRIVELLQQRGMEFQQQRLRTARPDTSSSIQRPMTTTSGLSSAHTGTPVGASRPSPFQPQTLEAGGLSMGASHSSDRPSTSASMYPNVLNSPSREMAPPSAFNFGQKAPFSADSGVRLASSQMLRSSSMQPQDQNTGPLVPERGIPVSSGEQHAFTFQRPSLPHIEEAPSLQRLDHDVETSNMRQWAHEQNFTGVSQVTSNDHGINRPVGARSGMSAMFPSPMTLEHEIPPARELPFKRPGSSRPGSATAPPSKPALVKAASDTVPRQSTASTKEAITASRPNTASPLKRSAMAADAEDSCRRPDTAVPIPRQPSPNKIQPAMAQTNSATTTKRAPSDMADLLRSHKPLSNLDPNCPLTTKKRLQSTADADFELDTPPRTSSPSPRRAYPAHPIRNLSPSPTRHNADSNDVTVNAYNSLRRAGGDDGLKAYAAQSRADRVAVLDEFMIEKLEDEGFIDLCEDMETCWKRIALGL